MVSVNICVIAGRITAGSRKNCGRKPFGTPEIHGRMVYGIKHEKDYYLAFARISE